MHRPIITNGNTIVDFCDHLEKQDGIVHNLASFLSRQRRRASLFAMAMVMAFGLDAAAVRAENVSYSLTLGATSPDMTDILIFETYPSQYAYASSYSFQAAGNATTVIVNPFNLRGLPAESFLMGIVNGLPSDGNSPVDHLVFFLNPSVATTILNQNLSFESLFPGTSEADLLTTFETVVRTASGTPDWNAAYSSLTSFFFNSVQSMTITTADGTSTVDGFFAGATDSTPGEATAIAFTDPQQIGTATSHIVGLSVPEPSSLTLAGIGALGCLVYC